jgi:hypothetical protein
MAEYKSALGSQHGLPIRAIIDSVDIKSGIIYVTFPLFQSNRKFPVKLPAGWRGPKGEFSGGYPIRNTNIFVQLSQGNEWVFVNYDQPDNTNSYDPNGTRRISLANKIKEGRWVTLVENDINLIVDPKDGVIAGGSTQNVQLDQNRGIYSSRFLQELHFTDAHREITGPVRRDVGANSSRNLTSSSLSSHEYNSALKTIGLDPVATVSNFSQNRNPALAESRSLYYEFVNSFGYTYDELEDKIYAGEDELETQPFQRKKSRTDTVSLSHDTPNYLAETIFGTVVDIYGNILDINRNILPNGKVDSFSFTKSEDDKNIVFRKLKNQLRKSIAYHFELNSRKDKLSLINYGDRQDYAKDRSLFSFDVDKEGQFKMNVPASSEEGNIGLLTRYSNFSNLDGFREDTDRGRFLRNSEGIDVEIESHGKGVVELTSSVDELQSFTSPIDRFDGNRIKLGTGFHEIDKILFLHKQERILAQTGGYPNSLINSVPAIEDVVSPSVTVFGENANAGGRSGTISLDGMINLSIGANTVDRQSMWLDCAGGIAAAIGRDKYQRSLAANFDGDVLIQIGGSTIADDSRFTVNNAMRDGTLDIRIINSGSCHILRIGPEGITLHTPQRMDIVSEGDMRFKSVNGNMYLDAENIFMYAQRPQFSRLVLKVTEGTAGRSI